MKRVHRHSDGFYHIKGKKYKNLVGSRKMVARFETAYKTKGNLTKADLYYNPKTDRVVSRKKHFHALKHNNLKKYGWTAKKGKFGAVRMPGFDKRRTRGRKGTRRTRRGRRLRGGGDVEPGVVSSDAIFKSTPASLK